MGVCLRCFSQSIVYLQSPPLRNLFALPVEALGLPLVYRAVMVHPLLPEFVSGLIELVLLLNVVLVRDIE